MSTSCVETTSSPEAAAADLNCIRLGAGDAVVLIHGLGSNLSFWFFGGAQRVAVRHHVIMYDLRGHGRSPITQSGYDLRTMAKDLLGLLDRIGVAQADIVGHSFGARVALTFAAEHPERLRKLVVADTQLRALQRSIRLAEWPHWSRWKAELQALGLENPPSDDSVIDHKLLAELSQYGDVANPAALEPRRIALRSRRMGPRGSQRWQQLMQHTTALREFEDESPLDREILATIAAPTLLMFGELSHCLPTADGLLQLLPNSHLIRVPGAGHFFPVVKPVFFERGLRRFLDGPESRVGGLRSMRARNLAGRARRRRDLNADPAMPA